MLAQMPNVDASTEIAFADGLFVLDDVYVAAVNEITKGHPERFARKDVMAKIGDYFAKEKLRDVQATVIRDHMRNYGL